MKHASLFFGLIVALGLLMGNCKPNQGPTSVFANNIGVYYMSQKLFKEAETFFKRTISASKGIPYRSYLNLADIYIIQGKEQQADSLYQIALESPVWETKALVFENIG